MALTASTDGPPPSPVTDSAAAQEAGRPASAVAGLVAGSGQNPQMPAGQDTSGIMVLGQKLIEGILTLAQAAPLIAPDMDQAQSIIMNALGKFAAQSVGGTGTSPTMPLAPAGAPPAGQGPAPATGGGGGAPVSQSGAQFPGNQGGGRPF